MKFEKFKRDYQKKEVEEYKNIVPESPLVSVSVHTYNHENYIADCLDAILKQKCNFDFEIIIGEDNSSDRTREICIDYANKHPGKIRLQLHNVENKIFISGVQTGRFNFIYKLYSARGKYIAFCDGDDFWCDENKLQEQIDLIARYPDINLCYHKVYKWKDLTLPYQSNKLVGRECGVGKIVHVEQIIRDYGRSCPMPSMLIRNKNIEQFVEIAMDVLELHTFLQIYFAHTNGALGINRPLSVYRSKTENSIRNKFKGKDNFTRIIKNRIEHIVKLNAYYDMKYQVDFKYVFKNEIKNIIHYLKLDRKDLLELMKPYEIKLTAFELNKYYFESSVKSFLKRFFGVVKRIKD